MELKTDGLLERTKNLVSTFESVNSVDNESSSSSLSSPSPLSPLMVFKAGTLLYETSSSSSNSNSNNNNNNQNKTSYELLAKAFHELLSSSNPDYLTHIIFRDIHTAFLSICNNYITTNNNGNGNSNDSQTLLTSIGAMCGIYDALSIQYQKNSNTCVMQHAFDVPLCNTLAKLYDYLLQHDDSTSTNANANASTVQEIKDCTLSILSSQLLYGLIYPTTTCSSTTTTSTKSSGEDDTIIQIMQVIQGLTEQQSSSSKVSYCLGDLQLWQRQVQQQQQQQQQQSQQSQQSTNLVSHHKPIVQVIQSIFSNDNEEYYAQKEYLISVLELAPQYDATQKEQTKLYNEQQQQQKQQQQNQTNKHKNKNNTNKKQSAIDRLIQQVYTILPHLGKGYIEAALACYNHNIEQTTNALMEGEFDVTTLHPRLRVLDKNLPARRKETKERYDLDINNIEFGGTNGTNGTNGNGNEMEMDREMKQEKEAKEIQKAKIKEMVQAQEDEAYKLQMVLQTMDLGDDSDDNDNNNNDDIHANIDNDAEYNDDYDDQYDKVADVGGGDTTSGLYDVDFDSIRAYNKVSKEMEADRLFWEGNRNTNVKPKGGVRTGKSSSSRQKKKNSGGGGGGGGGGNDNKHDDDNDDDDDNEGQKQYRGPEKGKGGRIIGPDGRYLPHPKSRKSKGGKKGNNTTPNDTTVSATEKGKSKDGGSGGGGGGKGKDGKGKDGKSKEELTKIQKRRKNDNKSKIGNHHRKERALKKTGM